MNNVSKFLAILAVTLLALIFGCEFPKQSSSFTTSSSKNVNLKVIDHIGCNPDLLLREIAITEKEMDMNFKYSISSIPQWYDVNYYLDMYSSVLLEDTTYTDTIEVYLVKDNMLCGELCMSAFARGTLDSNMVIDYPKYYNKVFISNEGLRKHALVHELGHLYGLKHTFNSGDMWGMSEAEIQEAHADEYNYMSYNCHVDNFSDPQRKVIADWHKIRTKRKMPP